MDQRRRISLLAILVSSATMSAANAATWDGFYLGATGGIAKTSAGFQTGPTGTGTYFATTSVPSINNTGNGSASDTGVEAGLTLGYSVQQGWLVYGAEGDIDWMRTKAKRSGTDVYPCCAPSTYTLDQYVKTDGLITARGRLGGAFGSSLIYATGGLAITSLKTGYEFSDNFGLNARSASTASRPRLGWVLGAGYEYSLGTLSIKAEYLYADFGSVQQVAPMTATGSSSNFSYNASVRTNIVRLGVNKKF